MISRRGPACFARWQVGGFLLLCARFHSSAKCSFAIYDRCAVLDVNLLHSRREASPVKGTCRQASARRPRRGLQAARATSYLSGSVTSYLKYSRPSSARPSAFDRDAHRQKSHKIRPHKIAPPHIKHPNPAPPSQPPPSASRVDFFAKKAKISQKNCPQPQAATGNFQAIFN